MTHTVIATFPDAEAARRAAHALGRSELVAGPTRVRVPADSTDSARLELRVEPGDAPRAIALMRAHGAEVSDRDDADDDRDLRTGDGPLAGWGMAIADAVTAAMGGASASDAQVPSQRERGDDAGRHEDRIARRDDAADAAVHPDPVSPVQDETGAPAVTDTASVTRARTASGSAGAADRDAAPIWGNAPRRGPAGSASGTHVSDTVAAGTGSNLGQVGPGTSIAASMGATDDDTGTASGTWTQARDPDRLARADDTPPRDPRPPRRRPKSAD